MIRDDYDQVDIDAPIPYLLTTRAHQDLAEWRREEADRCPSHEWKFENGGAVCQNCNRWASVGSDQSIPSHLHPRERRR